MVGRPAGTASRRGFIPTISSGPNQVWSWDITKLAGPERGVYYELFVIIDIFSRYVVAWTVAAAETGELAEAFIADALDRQGVSATSSPCTPTEAHR